MGGGGRLVCPTRGSASGSIPSTAKVPTPRWPVG